MNQIQTEFGGTNPIGMSEYYRLGPYVAGVVTTVPTSGLIHFAKFYSTKAYTLVYELVLSNSGSTLSDWQISFTLPYSAVFRTDFQDLVFADSNYAFIPHWYETVSSGVSALVWVRLPSLTNGGKIYVYKNDTLTTGNPDNVFLLYDSFTSTTLNTTKWVSGGGTYSATTSGLAFNNTAFAYIRSTALLGLDIIVEANLQSSSANAIPEIATRSNPSNNYGLKGRWDCRSGTNQGMGGILNNPYSAWTFVSLPNTTSFPSNNTVQKVTYESIGNTFRVLYNDIQQASSYTSTNVDFNTDGYVALMNHNGASVTWKWVRVRRGTAQTISASLVSGVVNTSLTTDASIYYIGNTQNATYNGTSDYSAFLNAGVVSYPGYAFGTNNANGGDWQWMTYMGCYNLDGTYNLRTFATQTEAVNPIVGYTGHWVSSTYQNAGGIRGVRIRNSTAFVTATGVCGPKDFRVYGKYGSGSWFMMGEFSTGTWSTTEALRTFTFDQSYFIDRLLVIVNTIHPTTNILLSRLSIGYIEPFY